MIDYTYGGLFGSKFDRRNHASQFITVHRLEQGGCVSLEFGSSVRGGHAFEYSTP